MTVKQRFPWLAVLLVLGASCAREPAPAAPPATAEEPTNAVTTWTDRTELFMEYPPLVAGREARFAIHLTNLADFSAVREGRVVVRLQGETIERFEVSGPSTPGIFGVTVKVPAARRYELAVSSQNLGTPL